jgi:adenine-specific DNA-methyltransferase
MDTTKKHFIDLFTGGGSVYTNVCHLYDKILVNDIISDLSTLHYMLTTQPSTIEIDTRKHCETVTDKDSYVKLRDLYNNDPSADKLWALMLTCTNNMLRFNKSFKFNQTYGERNWNSNTTKKFEEFVNHISKYWSRDKFVFKSRHFSKIVPTKNCMVYLDPPYDGTEAGYNAYWSTKDELMLYDYIKNIDDIGASFMVSGVLSHADTNSKLLSKLIEDGYKVIHLDCDYNKVSKVGNKNTDEVIIINY